MIVDRKRRVIKNLEKMFDKIDPKKIGNERAFTHFRFARDISKILEIHNLSNRHIVDHISAQISPSFRDPIGKGRI